MGTTLGKLRVRVSKPDLVAPPKIRVLSSSPPLQAKESSGKDKYVPGGKQVPGKVGSGQGEYYVVDNVDKGSITDRAANTLFWGELFRGRSP